MIDYHLLTVLLIVFFVGLLVGLEIAAQHRHRSWRPVDDDDDLVGAWEMTISDGRRIRGNRGQVRRVSDDREDDA